MILKYPFFRRENYNYKAIFVKKWLYIFLITTVLASCKKEADILGLGVQPPSDQIDVSTAEAVISGVITEPEDSLKSDELFPHTLIGNLIDPAFGRNTSALYTQLRLATTNAVIANPEIDSVVLSMVYKGFYGDTSEAQKWIVYRVTEDIIKDSSYYSNRIFQYDAVSLGELEFFPRPKDSVVVNGIKSAPQIRIPLSSAFGENILNSGALAGNESLIQFLKGIFIMPDTNMGKAIFPIDYEHPLTKLSIYYNDSLTYDLLINENSARVNNFSQNHLPWIFDQNAPYIYLQSMAGLKSKINFDFSALPETGTVIINNANLTMSVVDQNNSTFPPIERILLLDIRDDGTLNFIPDQLEGTAFVDGSYNSSESTYKINVTKYVQEIISGINANNGSYLVASGATINANRSIIDKQSLKLKITYSLLP